MKKLLAVGLVAALATVAAVVETPSKGPKTDCVREFRTGVTGHPGTLFTIGDGGIWFTEVREDRIGRLDPKTGRAQEIQLPMGSGPRSETPDPADPSKIWLAGITDRVIHFDLRTRKATFFTKGITAGAVPQSILVASDGNVYFTEQQMPNFAWLNTKTGKITEISQGVAPHPLKGVTADPDGRHLWATHQDADQLLRFDIATKKFDKVVPLPRGSGPHSLILGPDKHTLFVTFQYAGQIGSYDIRTGAIHAYSTGLPRQKTPDPQPAPKLLDLAIGPQGKSIWGTSFFANRVFRLDLKTGTVTEPVCGIKPGGSSLGVTPGPDGNIWFSSALSARIERVNDTK